MPESLKTGGFNPLKSNSSLAAKILRESRPEVDNDFSATRRPMVFEERKINGERSTPSRFSVRQFFSMASHRADPTHPPKSRGNQRLPPARRMNAGIAGIEMD